MNRAFRILWSHTRQAFVITDELASTRGKRSGARILLIAASLLANASPTLAAMGVCSGASTTITSSDSTTNGTCYLRPGASLTVTDGSINRNNSTAVDASMGGFASITNSGRISSTGSGVAISLYAGEGINSTGESIINLAGGTISGVQAGIQVLGGGNTFTLGSLENAGTIEATFYYGTGIRLVDGAILTGNLTNSGSINGNFGVSIFGSTIQGDIRNQASGTISGDAIGLWLGNAGEIQGNIHNLGTIQGGDAGISLSPDSEGGPGAPSLGGLINEGHIIATNATGAGIVLEGATLSDILVNRNRIAGGATGIKINDSSVASLKNEANASIYGSNSGVELRGRNQYLLRLDNAGTISSSDQAESAGIAMWNARLGQLNNSGTIQGTEVGLGMTDGSSIDGDVTNSGTIRGNLVGIYLSSDSELNGTLRNSGTLAGDHFALLDTSRTLTLLELQGNQAKLVGDVLAQGTDVVLKSGAQFTNLNAFDIKSFTVDQGATLKMGAGNSSSQDINSAIAVLHNDGFTVHDGFHNKGTLDLASGITGTIHGDYDQSANGKLRIGVSDDTGYGKLVVDGTATLASNAKIEVNVSPADYKFTASSLQNVLSATTLISDGTFAVSDNSTLFNFGAIKDGNTVDLNLTAASGNSGSSGLVEDIVHSLGNSPATGAAQVLDQVIGNNPTGKLASQFVGLTTSQQVSDAVTSTLPTVASNASNATSSTLASINRVVQARQENNNGLSSGDALADDNLWIKTFGSWAEQNERSGISGYDANTKGLAIGADAAFSDSTRLGLAFAYAQTSLDNDSSVAPQSAEIDTFQLIGYGSYALTPDTELNFQLDGGQNRTEGKRYMPFANATAKADYDGYNVHAGAGIGHTLHFSEQLAFVPSARLDYTWIGTESYQEKGAGALDLDINSNDAEELLLSVDGKLNYSLSDATVLSANLGAGYDLIDEDSSITSAYAGAPGAAFSTPGMNMEPWLARTGLGLTHNLANGTEVSLRYDAEARSGFTNQGASIKARWAF